jgi:hypothetical protein
MVQAVPINEMRKVHNEKRKVNNTAAVRAINRHTDDLSMCEGGRT